MPSVKPKIFRNNGLWLCKDTYYLGIGKTPMEAYDNYRWQLYYQKYIVLD